MRGWSVAGVVVAALALSGCGDEPGEIDSAGSGTDFSASVTVDGGEVTVEYTLRNTGDSTLVAFDRGWVDDAKSPKDSELAATKDDVQVIVHGDTVEFGLRVIHGCHGNPQGEIQEEPGTDSTDCRGDAPVSQRIAATAVKPGESISRDYRFDVEGVWPDYPTELAQTTMDLQGKEVRFCLGVDRPEKPAADDLYPPDTDERVLCGEPVTVDQDGP